MNWLDRAIALVAPEAGVRRASARLALEQVRSYDAVTSRRTEGWRRPGTSANAALGPALRRLQNSARDLARNNPYGVRIVNVMAGSVVGTGITPRFSVIKSRRRREAVQRRWAQFVTECDATGRGDLYSMQYLAARAWAESGAALMLWQPMPSSAGLAVPWTLRVLEPDYIDLNISDFTTGRILQGIEFEPNGRRVAYHLFDGHPGEAVGAGRFHSRRVDAAYVDHMFQELRPGQVHGAPLMTPIVMDLRDVGEAQEARAMQEKIAACFVAFVHSRAGSTRSPLAGGGATEKDSAGRSIARIQPGMIAHLEEGEDVKFGEPSPVNGFADYLRIMLRAAAAGAGLTYEQLTGDLTGVNYSSARIGRLEHWAQVDVLQWHMVVPQQLRPAVRRFAQHMIVQGLMGPDEVGGVEFSPPERAFLDPERDVKGIVAEVRAGLKSLPDAIASRGQDPDKQLAEIASANAQLDALGITLDCDPRKFARAGAAAMAAPKTTPKEMTKDDETE